MKYSRVYETSSRFYGGKTYECKELVGYKCEKGYIKVTGFVTLSGNVVHEYYANGWRFSTLKDAKRELEAS